MSNLDISEFQKIMMKYCLKMQEYSEKCGQLLSELSKDSKYKSASEILKITWVEHVTPYISKTREVAVTILKSEGPEVQGLTVEGGDIEQFQDTLKLFLKQVDKLQDLNGLKRRKVNEEGYLNIDKRKSNLELREIKQVISSEKQSESPTALFAFAIWFVVQNRLRWFTQIVEECITQEEEGCI